MITQTTQGLVWSKRSYKITTKRIWALLYLLEILMIKAPEINKNIELSSHQKKCSDCLATQDRLRIWNMHWSTIETTLIKKKSFSHNPLQKMALETTTGRFCNSFQTKVMILGRHNKWAKKLWRWVCSYLRSSRKPHLIHQSSSMKVTHLTSHR